VPTVLIELPDGEGVVRRDDGEIVVTEDVSDDRGQPLEGNDRYQPVNMWVHGDRSLVGGLLPPGAVSAEVIDARGARVAARLGGDAYAAVSSSPSIITSRLSAAATPPEPPSDARSLTTIQAHRSPTPKSPVLRVAPSTTRSVFRLRAGAADTRVPMARPSPVR
jgi:hypothetical protein